MLTVSAPIQVKKSSPQNLSAAQKTFQRLKKKIESLQCEAEMVEKDLEKCLKFHHSHILPMRKEFIEATKEMVIVLYRHYKDKKRRSSMQNEALRRVILNNLDQVLQSTKYTNVDPEIAVIFEELEGVSVNDVASQELNNFKETMQAMFKNEVGGDIDLSLLENADDEIEIMRKIVEAMGEAKTSNMEKKKEEVCKPKSKKQLLKEQKVKEFEALQKREISTVYKQLAKVFHPDLEQDLEEKKEKEKLMKRLTSAYDNGDLHALLLLEMEWMNRTSGQGKVQSDDQLKIYNSLLKDQIASLEENIAFSMIHPRYFPIQPYIAEDDFLGLMTLELDYHELKAKTENVKNILSDLQGKNGSKIVLEIVEAAGCFC